jgi:hypothetical protein
MNHAQMLTSSPWSPASRHAARAWHNAAGSRRRLRRAAEPTGYEKGKPERGNRTSDAFYLKYGVSLNWLVSGEAGNIGSHLAKGAKGKVAILPVVGLRQRRAREMPRHPPFGPTPAA